MTTDTVAATRRTCELLGIDRVRRGLPAFTERRAGDPYLTCFIAEGLANSMGGYNEFMRFIAPLSYEDEHAVRTVYERFELSTLRPIIHHAVLAWLAEQEAIEAVTQPVPDVRTVGL